MPIDSRSRVEDILNVILGNLDPSALQPPQSRVEALLQRLNEMISDFDGKIPVHICTSGEYDHETLMPTIEDPEENAFYLVPANESGDDMYIEWIFTETNRWERFGSGGGSVTIKQSDWNQNDSSQADFIKNKPDLTLKLDKNQGAANSGKFMGVNSSGNVVPLEVECGNIAVTEELVTGEDYELTVEEGETGSVISVAGKTGTVTLDGDDVVFNDATTYNDGTIGGTVADLKSQMSAKASIDMALGAYPTDTVSGGVASFSDGADSISVKDLTIAIEPVQSGSGDPSPDNVRPISGWTGVNMTQTGANILGGTPLKDNINAAINATVDSVNKTISFGRYAQKADPSDVLCTFTNGITFKPNTQYTLILAGTALDNIANIMFVYTDGTNSRTRGEYIRIGANVSASGKTLAGVSYRSYNGTTVLYYDNCGLFEGVLTADDFIPYVGTTTPIAFHTEAGTVYGGTLDVTTGALTVDRVCVDLGDWTWTKGERNNSDTGYSYHHRETNYVSGYLLSSNRKVYVGTKVWTTLELNEILMAAGYFVVVLDVATATEAKAALAGSKVVYKIIQPQTYQLTPVEVLTLLGANTIYADTGDTTVTYRADPTLYADKRSTATRSIIAGIEPTMTASKAYTTGQLLIVGDTLYKVAASIASGATLTPGTNVNQTTVAEQLILLANA